MALRIPEQLAASCRKTPERMVWLRALDGVVRELERRWSLTIHAPFEGPEITCGWVAPVTLSGGTSAILKLGMPHLEGQHEIAGLRFWDGDPVVRLLRADEECGAMVLERCRPGSQLQELPESQQDAVIAGLLVRLWSKPAPVGLFRPLSLMLAHWSEETLAAAGRWPDAGLVRDGLRLFQDLPRTAPRDVVLATDLHPSNVLRAEREPWLVIDPKPFTGDPAYDATQHLLGCEERLRADPHGTIGRFADLLGLDRERVRLWTFARAAAGPRRDWRNAGSLARILAH